MNIQQNNFINNFLIIRYGNDTSSLFNYINLHFNSNVPLITLCNHFNNKFLLTHNHIQSLLFGFILLHDTELTYIKNLITIDNYLYSIISILFFFKINDDSILSSKDIIIVKEKSINIILEHLVTIASSVLTTYNLIFNDFNKENMFVLYIYESFSGSKTISNQLNHIYVFSSMLFIYNNIFNTNNCNYFKTFLSLITYDKDYNTNIQFKNILLLLDQFNNKILLTQFNNIHIVTFIHNWFTFYNVGYIYLFNIILSSLENILTNPDIKLQITNLISDFLKERLINVNINDFLIILNNIENNDTNKPNILLFNLLELIKISFNYNCNNNINTIDETFDSCNFNSLNICKLKESEMKLCPNSINEYKQYCSSISPLCTQTGSSYIPPHKYFHKYLKYKYKYSLLKKNF